METPRINERLVNGEELLEALFSPEARPSMRWLRRQLAARALPFVRIGRKIFFDVELVRKALANRNLVRGRYL
jgi:hypothetical protein